MTSNDKNQTQVNRRASKLLLEGPDTNGIDLFNDTLLNTKQLSAWLGIAEITAKIWRMKGYGPVFIKPSPKVCRYKYSDVLEWLKKQSSKTEV